MKIRLCFLCSCIAQRVAIAIQHQNCTRLCVQRSLHNIDPITLRSFDTNIKFPRWSDLELFQPFNSVISRRLIWHRKPCVQTFKSDHFQFLSAFQIGKYANQSFNCVFFQIGKAKFQSRFLQIGKYVKKDILATLNAHRTFYDHSETHRFTPFKYVKVLLTPAHFSHFPNRFLNDPRKLH